ncbi:MULTISPECIES: pilus assembly protein TadG-related protein [unclassified Novosphingobium]|uniref:TadG family pilus assembly protein n=1 Tax=unclassified Novosphingobium TaxID=2644732 RepID=UPI001F24D62B|nr:MULTISPECIES: pilus assembly protein TadG-related protein [unclassified Novosphingobium]
MTEGFPRKRRLRPLRELGRDDSGVVGPMIAVLGVSLLAAAGLALDVALYYSGNRDLRSATEAAALAAAMDPTQAQSRAVDYLTRNGYDASVLKKVEVGYYCANISRASGSRFVAAGSADVANCPGSSVNNAVRLTTGKASRQFLSGTLGGASPIPQLGATASAARVDEAGIAVTSGLLTVTNTLVNSVNDLLGALLGIKLRLSTADIEALMGGNVDAGRFFDALAKRAGQSGTYQQLTQGTYGIQDIAYAAADATYAGNTVTAAATATALRTFGAAAGNGYRVPLAGLFGLGVWKNMPVGGTEVRPGLRAGLNAYQLISYAVQGGPGAIDASDLVSLVVPNSTVAIRAVGTGLADRPRFAFGPAGETTVGTSMLRLQVDVQVVNLNLLNVVGAKAEVPLVIDVDAAQATISKIDCAGKTEQNKQTTVTLAANSGLVNVYLGRLVNANAMTKPVPILKSSDFAYTDILGTSLLGIGLVSVQGKAIVQPVIGASNNNVSFVPAPNQTFDPAKPISFGGGVVVGNKLQVGATVQGLTRDLQLRTCVTPLICLGTDTQAVSNVLSVVNTVGGVLGGTVDPLLDNILAALGVELGHATVWVSGARCGVPVLI